MKLPGVERADVPKRKVTKYLLSAEHASGRTKATWFTAHGFSAEAWEKLAESLREHASQHEVATREETPFGTRYTVEGPLQTPDGRNPHVRSVWFVEHDHGAARFVTAYPLRRRSNDQRT